MSTLPTVLQRPWLQPHPSAPVWQGASGKALAAQGCPSQAPISGGAGGTYHPVGSTRHEVWGTGPVTTQGKAPFSGGQSLLRALQDITFLCPCGKRFVPSPYLGQVKALTFIISSFTFPSRERAVPPPSHDWLIESQQSFAMT